MTPPPAHECTFFRIPKDSPLAESAQKYKQLRLRALSIAPASLVANGHAELLPEDFSR
ncbi:hypothetical protein BP00DRAFT_449907 [Aspergillus indologenus CBS 114.80]|uniref:Uncharacterized protein n=1 Tax=Aspergillus indologenus CBS 114.80 TaxID=1450541 RepID=A0A2V5IH34_9EURO|nr:hypothetical protein BP00DRAFT_449907 [Aspergillus indologenus CBS 114.80]